MTHRLPRRRQGRAAAARPRRPPGDAGRGRRARRRTDPRIWQCRQALGRRDPALPAPASRPGRRPFLRRARARTRGFPQARREWPRHRQHPRRRPADGEPAPLLDLPAVAAVANCSNCSPRSATSAKPKLAFFFDEAHLLFDDAPPALLEKVEQVVRLIRSKGVGVYFITQNPIDIPDKVAGQLGNRVQHALRAFTPRDEAAVRSAADTFRTNPEHRRRHGHHRTQGRRGAGLVAPARRRAVAGRAHA